MLKNAPEAQSLLDVCVVVAGAKDVAGLGG